MSDKIFADGVFFKKPREGAPGFVKGSVSIKLQDFKPFAEKHANDGWINLDLKESQGGKLYFQLNTWKPEGTFDGAPAHTKPASNKQLSMIRGMMNERDITNVTDAQLDALTSAEASAWIKKLEATPIPGTKTPEISIDDSDIPF